MRLARLLFSILSLLPIAGASAGGVNMREGLWEMTSSTDMAAIPGMPKGMFKKNPKVDDVVGMCGCTGPDNVKLVVMGTIDSGGSGCMCPANAFVKALLRHVITREKDLVILDMEAGIEHLGRVHQRMGLPA